MYSWPGVVFFWKVISQRRSLLFSLLRAWTTASWKSGCDLAFVHTKLLLMLFLIFIYLFPVLFRLYTDYYWDRTFFRLVFYSIFIIDLFQDVIVAIRDCAFVTSGRPHSTVFCSQQFSKSMETGNPPTYTYIRKMWTGEKSYLGTLSSCLRKCDITGNFFKKGGGNFLHLSPQCFTFLQCPACTCEIKQND